MIVGFATVFPSRNQGSKNSGRVVNRSVSDVHGGRREAKSLCDMCRANLSKKRHSIRQSKPHAFQQLGGICRQTVEHIENRTNFGLEFDCRAGSRRDSNSMLHRGLASSASAKLGALSRSSLRSRSYSAAPIATASGFPRSVAVCGFRRAAHELRLPPSTIAPAADLTPTSATNAGLCDKRVSLSGVESSREEIAERH